MCTICVYIYIGAALINFKPSKVPKMLFKAFYIDTKEHDEYNMNTVECE